MLMIKGKIEGKNVRKFDGKEFVTLKFAARLPDGDLMYLEVRWPEELDHEPLQVDMLVEIPISYYVSKNQVYFRALAGAKISSPESTASTPAPAPVQANAPAKR